MTVDVKGLAAEFVADYFTNNPPPPLERDVTDGLKPKSRDIVQAILDGELASEIGAANAKRAAEGRERKDPAERIQVPAEDGAGIINRPVTPVDQVIAEAEANDGTLKPQPQGQEAEIHHDSELDSDTMVVELTPQQLRRILGVGACASKDQARPILCTISVKHRFNKENDRREFVFAATDSYTLAKLTMAPGEYRWNPVTHPREVMVPFAELKAAANAAIKAAGKLRPLIKVTFDEKNTTLETSGFSQSIRHTEGTFPNYEQLIGKKVFDITDNKGKLPAVSPTVLKQLTEAFSSLATERNYPMRMFFTSVEGNDLKPMGFVTTHLDTTLETIIMPVRVA